LAEYPALLSWQGNDWDRNGGLLGIATGAYGDAGDPERERWFTRAACAELLIDAGAVVAPSVCEGLLGSRAKGLLQLFQRKDLVPHTLEFFAALGDLDAVRTSLDDRENAQAAVNEAFMCACRFEHDAVATLLLERSIAFDPELGQHLDGTTDRVSFIRCFKKSDLAQAAALGPWKVFVMEQVTRAVHDKDLTAFVRGLQREPWLLGETYLEFQAGLIETATLNDRGEFISALLDLDPALLRRQPPPSKAIEWAFVYANTQLLPLLTRIWPMPDDLPHAAAMGNLSRVKHFQNCQCTGEVLERTRGVVVDGPCRRPVSEVRLAGVRDPFRGPRDRRRAVAQFFGELRAFAADPRWMTSALIIALSAYQLVALPRAIEGFWENLSPWLSNSDEEIAFLKAQTRPLLARSRRPSSTRPMNAAGRFIYFSRAAASAMSAASSAAPARAHATRGDA
jgi:hypothetical protein